MNKIPNKLREYRKKVGLKQSEVAEKIGLNSTDRISRWEKGETFPHVVNLLKLSELYKVCPCELYGEIVNKSE